LILLRNGVGLCDLQSLDIDDAATLLEIILDTRDEDSAQLSKFLKSPKGRGVQPVVEISSAGNPY